MLLSAVNKNKSVKRKRNRTMEQHKIETGAVAIAYSFNPGKSVHVTEVRVHLSAVGGAAENLTIKHNSALGAAYDVLHHTEAMAAVADLVWRPDLGPWYIAKGDTLDIAYANSNNRTYGLEILYR